MNPKILPTVGRMVHYHALGSADGRFPVGEARAAIITAVIDAEAGIISLAILNPTGMYFNQKVEQGTDGGKWDWMPFQKDQQARPGYGATPTGTGLGAAPSNGNTAPSNGN